MKAQPNRILRIAWRQPLFTGATIALVALSVAATVTLAGITHSILFEALPYADSDRIVALRWAQPEQGIPDMALSYTDARELIDRTDVIEDVSATLTPIDLSLDLGDGARHVTGGIATPESFGLLGVQLVLGRGFTAAEGGPGLGDRVAVLSYDAWATRFGADPTVLGRVLELDGRPVEVVGVLPPERTLAPEQPIPIDIWLPTGLAEEYFRRGVLTNPGSSVFRVNGRLRSGTSPSMLAEALGVFQEGMAAEYPESHDGWDLHADRLRDRMFGDLRSPLLGLTAGSLLLAGVAFVNLLALFLHQRQKGHVEVATRRALGASREDLRTDALAKAGYLGILSGAVAASLVWAGTAVFAVLNPVDLPSHLGTRPSPLMLIGALLAAPAVCLVAALLSLPRPPESLRASSPTRRNPAATSAWLGAQVTLTSVLMIASFSLARSLAELRGRPTGMDVEGLLAGRMEVSTDVMPSSDTGPLATEVIRVLRDQPGVTDGFIWSPALPTEARLYTAVFAQDALVGDGEQLIARYHSISAGAATRLGLAFSAGRDFSEDDRESGRRVALVSKSAAELWWGGVEAALGRQIRRTSHPAWSEVVGVVEDASFSGRFGPGSANVIDTFFLFDQDPRSTLMVFARAEPDRVSLSGLREALDAVHRDVPYFDQRWMSERVRDQERIHGSVAIVSAIYAFLSLLIAGIGLAGVSVLSARRRRREIGIRQAVGAAPARLIRDLLPGQLLPVLAGVLVGALAAPAGLGMLDPVLLTVGPADPVGHGAALVTVLVVGCAALSIPLGKAARLDPVECLREG